MMRDLFAIDAGVEIGFVKLKAAFPPLAAFFSIPILGPTLEWLIKHFLKSAANALARLGVWQIDLTVDAIQIAYNTERFREDARRLYEKTIQRKYTEEEKEVIRQQYEDHLRKLGLSRMR